MRKYFIFLTIGFLVFNYFYNFSQAPLEVRTADGAVAFGNLLLTGQAQIPLPEEEKTIVGGWKKVHQQIMKYWKENILPRIQQWFEEKKPEIKEQFEKEKTELKRELRKTLSNFWQWLKDLIK